MTEMHEEVRALLPAYVMDAVPAEEVAVIRAHIMACEECFAEVDEYSQSLAALVDATEPASPPPGFTERVLSAARGATAAPGGATAVPGGAAGDRWGWLRRAFLPAAAGLAALALIFVSVSLVDAVDRQRQYEQALAAVLEDPGALTLEGPGGAEAVIADTGAGSTLIAVNLGEAPKGRDYQLWLMKDGIPTPSNTFDVDRDIVIIDALDVPPSYDGAAITVEPEGGSSQPTTEPILSS